MMRSPPDRFGRARAARVLPESRRGAAARIDPPLPGEALATAEDDRLAESEIVDIVASAGGLRLTVVIAGAPQAVLDRAAGWLRGELAAGMNRRRVPALHLVAVAPRGPGGAR
jgi:hypothetical protein